MRVWDYHEEQEYEVARRLFRMQHSHMKVAKWTIRFVVVGIAILFAFWGMH